MKDSWEQWRKRLYFRANHHFTSQADIYYYINELKDIVYDSDDIKMKIEDYKEEWGRNCYCFFLDYLEIDKDIYDKIVDLLNIEFSIVHKRGGRKPKLSISEWLDATMLYCIYGKTYKSISETFNINESNIYNSIRWVITVLTRMKIMKTVIDNYDKQAYTTINLRKIKELHKKMLPVE